MGINRSKKRLLAAALAIVGVASGSVAVHAATFNQRALGAPPTPVFGSIPMTCTAACSIDLQADRGVVNIKDTSLPAGNQDVPFFGFGVNPTGGPAAGVSLAGGATSTIKIPVNTTVTIHLVQDLTDIADPIALSFPSLSPADFTGSAGVFTLHPTKVGTSVFQPGTNKDAPKQVAMGLVGVLIVTPAGCNNCAYDSTPYAEEALVATTDLDPAFAADPASFDMGYFGQAGLPDGSARQVYHLINGKSFPQTDVIDVKAGESLLIRSVNAGVTDKSMGLLGLRQTLLGRNSRQYTNAQTLVAPLVGPGETADIAVKVPGEAADGQMYSLMDQGRQMNHGNANGFGGALTFIYVWSASYSGATVDGPVPDVVVGDGTSAQGGAAVQGGTQGGGAQGDGTSDGQNGAPSNQGGAPSDPGGAPSDPGGAPSDGSGTGGAQGAGSGAQDGASGTAGP